MPLAHPLINSNLFITISLLFLLALSAFISVHHRKRFNILSAVFRPASAREYSIQVASGQITTLIMTIFAVLGYATMLLYVSGQPDVWLNLGGCVVAVLLFFCIKYYLVNLFFSTMYAGVEKDFIGRYHKLQVLFGIITFIACMILAYTFDSSSATATVISIVIGVMYSVSIIYIFIVTFFNNINSIFSLFLYLCTFEILPVLVLIKALRAIPL